MKHVLLLLILLASSAVWAGETDLLANLPPDPGAAGKATLAGIDSDNDGVRDDVQRWIALTYPNSKKNRAALRQLAVDLQNSILDTTSKSVARSNAMIMQKSLACLRAVNTDYYNTKPALKAKILNTAARSRAFLKWNYLLSGRIYKGIARGIRNCNFDPNAMPN